jgi:tRNA-Thr(GGU) m(6)t(6)A37 methyltransferase TsaA
MRNTTVAASAVVLLTSLAPLALRPPLSAEADQPRHPNESFTVHPIGQVKKSDERTWVVLDEKYEPGLLGLEGFSHLYVFWWLDRNDTPEKRAVLQVHPRGDRSNPLTGVFATRSPVRPNLIALTLCKVLSVEGTTIEVEKIDAFDGTPVLDLKPFIPGYDSASDAKVPDWLGRPRRKDAEKPGRS